MNNWHLARGYRFAGARCGIRPDPDRLDLALVVSDAPAAAAGAFTQNRVRAAPVRVCQERLPADDDARRRRFAPATPTPAPAGRDSTTPAA